MCVCACSVCALETLNWGINRSIEQKEWEGWKGCSWWWFGKNVDLIKGNIKKYNNRNYEQFFQRIIIKRILYSYSLCPLMLLYL